MNGYTTTCCIYNLHHPIEPSKLPFNWIHILDSQIFFDALCICAATAVHCEYDEDDIREVSMEFSHLMEL